MSEKSENQIAKDKEAVARMIGDLPNGNRANSGDVVIVPIAALRRAS